jgi:uncharacterized protein YbjT (DUF2867 family)
MSDKPVLVIGGTRATGLYVVHILQRQNTPVRVLARNPEAALERIGSHAETVQGDLTKADTLTPAFANVSHLIFTAGVERLS